MLPSFRLNAVAFSLLVSAYFVCINLPLLARLREIVAAGDFSAGFVASIPAFLLAAFNLILIPLAGCRAGRALLAVLMALSAAASYAAYNYGVIFSREMMANIAGTDSAEALSYLNAACVLWVFFLGIVPAFIVLRTEASRTTKKKAMLSQMYSAMLSLLAISLIAAVYYQDYAVTLRNNADLKRRVIPTYALSSGYKFVKERYFTAAIPYTQVAPDARPFTVAEGKKRSLTVLVVGETARAGNYSLNGHAKDTNRYTRPRSVINFGNVTSCGTETAVSVPCMFSNLTRAGYSLRQAEARDNLLDVLSRAGVHVVWLENNGGCKGVCRNVKSVDIRQAYAGDSRYCGSDGCYDGALIPELEKQIAALDGQDAVIVLHLMGSHGPAYYRRYPADQAVFKPDCRRSDIQNCTPASLENAYDNTILYTDRILAGVIDVLAAAGRDRDVSMLYLSDHGESLGENGIYLHGLPYAVAPEMQKKIPLIVWMPDAVARRRSVDRACLEKNGNRQHYSQDNLFHTMLWLAGVGTKDYRQDMDLFAACRARLTADLR